MDSPFGIKAVKFRWPQLPVVPRGRRIDPTPRLTRLAFAGSRGGQVSSRIAPASLGLQLIEELLKVFWRHFSVLLVPNVLVALRVEEDEVVDRAVLVSIIMRAQPSPYYLIDKSI